MSLSRIDLAMVFAAAFSSASAQTVNYPIGSTVANFGTLDTEGQFHMLYDYTAAGRTVMLDFFFYDCIPCQEYAPSFSELYETYGCNQGGLVCFHVNGGVDSDEMSEQFAIDFGGDFAHPPTIGSLNGGQVAGLFGVSSFPTLCVIAPDNSMWNDNVWPVDLETLTMNFPEGTQIQPMSCAVGGVGTARSGSITADVRYSNTSAQLFLRTAIARRSTLEIRDVIGRKLHDMDLGIVPAGESSIVMDFMNGSSGTYLLVIRSEDAPILARRLFIQ